MIKHGDKVSLTMITLNEERAVEKVIKDIQNLDQRIEINIVDSSSDDTAKIAEKLGANVFYQIPPKGYGPAMDYALNCSSREVIITIDCDDTYPLDQVDYFSKLIIDEDYDVVDGNRLPSKPKNMPYLNYIGNYLFALFASILFFKRIRDLHSGMRAYKKIIINKLPYENKGIALPVELILWPIRLKLKIKTINIEYKSRIGESKLAAIKVAWSTLIKILRARFKKI